MKSIQSPWRQQRGVSSRTWRWTSSLLVCVLFFSLAGCFSGPRTSTTFLPDYYKTDYDRVWNSAIDTLDELGFVILNMRKAEGYLSTDWRERKGVRYKVAMRFSISGELVRVKITSSKGLLIFDKIDNRYEWVDGTNIGMMDDEIKKNDL
jgi:hypothetical protein